MAYLVFMNYVMLIAICGNMGIITSSKAWIVLDIIGVIALMIHCYLKEKQKKYN